MQLNLTLPHVSENLIPHSFADDMLNAFSKFIDTKSLKQEGSLTAKLTELKNQSELGAAMREWDQSSIMQKFNKTLKIIISKKYGVTLESFPINAVRVSLTSLDLTKLPWHQDEATWITSEALRNKFPFTAWVPLMSPKLYDGIEIFNMPYTKLHWHRQVDRVGYFGGEGFQEISSEIDILKSSTKKGDVTFFSSLAPHRTYSENIDPSEARVSMDFRFVPEKKIAVAVSRKHWKYLIKDFL
jgi:hypothetical protein